MKISDGALYITQGFTIAVSELPPVNRAPVITPIPSLTAIAGVVFTYDVDATDPDGDILVYSLATTYTDMIINSTTGVISWIPTIVGNFTVIVQVSDGELSDTQSFTITVIAGEAAKLLWVDDPVSPATSGEPWYPAFSIEITDGFGNRTLDIHEITIITTGTEGTITAGETAVAEAGLATFGAFTYTLTVTTVPDTITIIGKSATLTDTPASNEVTIPTTG
ncbi:hypothetical protein ES708_23305 [subsurface metagenome]